MFKRLDAQGSNMQNITDNEPTSPGINTLKLAASYLSLALIMFIIE